MRGCILLGAPGSGKGTQAKRLQDKFQIPHISTGDILRREIAVGSSLGLKVKEILAAGTLVDDSLMTEIVKKRFSESDVLTGFILDGFPRTVPQAESLSTIFKEKKIQLPIAIYLKLSNEKLMDRLLGRLTCSRCGSVFHLTLNPPKKNLTCDACGFTPLVQRKDDNPETVSKRLEVFNQETSELLNFYSQFGMLQTFDGDVDVDVLTSQLEAVLQREAS